ncbi:MAG: hypothetical protein B7Y51_08065, partial [Burkholderiales bacterium 28-67-8]
MAGQLEGFRALPGTQLNKPLKRSPNSQAAGAATQVATNGSLRVANDFLFTSESVSEGHPDKVA